MIINLEKYNDDLMAIPGVVGTGKTMINCKPVIMIKARQDNNEIRTKVNSVLRGLPFKIEVVGDIKA